MIKLFFLWIGICLGYAITQGLYLLPAVFIVWLIGVLVLGVIDFIFEDKC